VSTADREAPSTWLSQDAYDRLQTELAAARQRDPLATGLSRGAAVDLLVRHMAGSPVETAELPQRLFDKSNVPSGKGWSGDVDYKASYRELWGR